MVLLSGGLLFSGAASCQREPLEQTLASLVRGFALQVLAAAVT
jgi:hypothetical protein